MITACRLYRKQVTMIIQIATTTFCTNEGVWKQEMEIEPCLASTWGGNTEYIQSTSSSKEERGRGFQVLKKDSSTGPRRWPRN